MLAAGSALLYVKQRQLPQSPLCHWHTLAAAPKISTKDHATGLTNHFGNLGNTVAGFVLLGNPTQPERCLVYCKFTDLYLTRKVEGYENNTKDYTK